MNDDLFAWFKCGRCDASVRLKYKFEGAVHYCHPCGVTAFRERLSPDGLRRILDAEEKRE